MTESDATAPAHSTLPAMLAPLRQARFRRLWLAMSTSYAGDRLQHLAQGWLVATLTQSAIGVGLISAWGAIPLLLIPLGGVIAERCDRRRVVWAAQIVGALITLAMVGLLASQRIAVWHVYAWTFVNGMSALVARPAYKVLLTEAVAAEELRAAVALNSLTETIAMVLVSVAGSMLLGAWGLQLAFVLNAGSYAVAAVALWNAPARQPRMANRPGPFRVGSLFAELGDGCRYLHGSPTLFPPLLLTFATVLLAGPVVGLLPVIVHQRGGSIVELGVLTLGASLGSLAGALIAGVRAPGPRPAYVYALLGLLAAAGVAVFALTSSHAVAFVALAAISFVAFAEAVWNTARVAQIAPAAYQARLQAITSMAFTLGIALGALWGGTAFERWDMIALLGGGVALAAWCAVALARQRCSR